MQNRIRSVELSDAEAVRAIYAPYILDSAISFEAVVPDAAEIRRRIAAQIERYPWLVFESGERVLGYAYASSHRTRHAYQWAVEVSVYIDQSCHRSGIGRALYTALFDLLRRQHFVDAYAGIALPNLSSIGLHESLGFEHVGVYRQIGFKFGRWHDVVWLHLQLREKPSAPSAPLTAAEAWQQPDVEAMLNRSARMVRVR